MKQTLLSLFATSLLLAMPPATAADIDNGASLHQKFCTSCHDSGVYTRADRKVTTLEGLQTQVGRCDQSLGLKWFDDDIADVAAYLNQSHYHFK
ncbi:MAG: cytochrome c [Gammaproteobacteria bacterium]|jgi:cytochrome c553